jgi:DNA-binding transcriptional regulator GbsR (MarR family)
MKTDIADPQASRSPLTTEELEAARRRFVEDYGVFVESRGQLPRMAGRIMGQLLLTNDALQTQADLCQALQASAGAISSTLRLLQERGYVERVSLPGIRKDFYRIADEIWTRNLERAQQHYEVFNELTARGLRLSSSFDEGAQTRLREMHDLAQIEAAHFEQLLAHWHDYRRQRASGPPRPTAATRRRQP